ncbi:MAG: L,D-transpeptidase family protein [Mycobacteriales bacterium]
MRRSSALTALALTGAIVCLPTAAYAAPAEVTGLTGAVGDHHALLSWSGGGSAGAVVRDVTGVSGAVTPTSGTAVASSGTTAADSRFLNTTARTYAVWAQDTDSSTSANPATVTVNPVAAVPTALTLGVSRAVANYGQQYAASGVLTRGGNPSPNMRVDLLARVGGTSTYTVARRMTTDASGAIKAVLVSTRNIDLALRYAGDAFSQPSGSAHRIVQMQPTVTATFSPNVVVRPEATTLQGHVPGGLPGAVIRIQRRQANGTFGTLTSVSPDGTGNWSYRYTPGSVGKFVYRAVLPAQPSYLSGVSAPRVLEVDTRDLSIGDAGDDVLTLERQLLALHYSPGRIDGSFDRNTQHAVITFQKVEGLPRLGTWTKAERTQMGHRRGYRLRYPSAGRAVEVDITRQVVVYSEGGVIKMIVDTSTGGEYRYYYEGGSDIAHTPRGTFQVERKIDGVRTSKLGYLYRPSYFVGGFALHGEAYDVPTYPASHGCVRMTNYNTDLLYAKLSIGTPVHVFDE